MRCTTERCQHHMLEFPFIIICVGEIGTTDSTVQYASIQASSCAAYLASAMRPLPRVRCPHMCWCCDTLTFGVCVSVFVYVVVVCSCVCILPPEPDRIVYYFLPSKTCSLLLYIHCSLYNGSCLLSHNHYCMLQTCLAWLVAFAFVRFWLVIAITIARTRTPMSFVYRTNTHNCTRTPHDAMMMCVNIAPRQKYHFIIGRRRTAAATTWRLRPRQSQTKSSILPRNCDMIYPPIWHNSSNETA